MAPPLQDQSLELIFAGGQSSKLDPAIVDRAKLLSLTNGTFNKTGTIARRDPWAFLPGTGAITATEMIAFGNELLVIDSATNNLLSYSPTQQAMINRGTPPYFQFGLDPIAAANSYKDGLDHAYAGGFSIYVWRDSVKQGGVVNGVYYTVVDDATSAVLVNAGAVSTSANCGKPRVVVGGPSGGHFLVAYEDNATLIKMVSIVASTGAVYQGPMTVASDAAQSTAPNPTAIYLDLMAFSSGGGGLALLAYTSSKGSTKIGALLFNYLGVVTNAEITAMASGLLSGDVLSIALTSFSTSGKAALLIGDSSGTAVWTTIIGYDGTTLSVSSASKSVTVTATSYVLSAVADPAAPGTIRAFSCYACNNNVKGVTAFRLDTSNLISSKSDPFNFIQQGTMYAVNILATRAFASDTTVYVGVAVMSTLQTGLYFLDAAGNVVGNMLYGGLFADPTNNTTLGTPTSSTSLPTVVAKSTSSFSVPALKQGTLTFSGGLQTSQAGVARGRLTIGRASTTGAGTTPSWHAQAGNNLYFSGAYMGMYDGFQAGEAGFFYFPEGCSSATSGAGTTATIQYVAVYEWTDAHGQRHQSAPSVPLTVSAVNAGTITISAPTLQLGVRANSCTVVFYRTVNNGTTFYRLNAANAPLGNTKSAYRMSYGDTTWTASPDTITANEILYTTGGALPNDNPPACNAIAAHQGRILFSNAEDGQEWRFSQAPVANQGLYFNELLLGGRTPQDAGSISGIGAVDDKLIIGTSTRKFVSFGSGPASNGLGGSYSAPQPLPTDVGFVDQRNITALPDVSAQDGAVGLQCQGGLAYQSKHGYYLLGRGLSDRYIGMPVEPTITAGTAVSSAVVLQDKHQLRLTVGASVIVFDYLMGQWSTFSQTTGFASSFGCACIYGGKWTGGGRMGPAQSALAMMMANTLNGLQTGLFQDQARADTGVGTDYRGYYIVVGLTTAWLKLASLQGFQRVRAARFFGPYAESGTLSLSAQYDYDSTSLGSTSITTSALATADGTRWQLGWQVPVQKCEAIRFTLSDLPLGGSNSGIGFTGLVLEVAVKSGQYKLPATKSL